MEIHPFLLTLYVIFLVWVVVFMKNSKCVEKHMDYFSVVKTVSIQDHILFSIYHSNSWRTKVITLVGSLYNYYVVFFSCPWPETNIVVFYSKVTILVNDVILMQLPRIWFSTKNFIVFFHFLIFWNMYFSHAFWSGGSQLFLQFWIRLLTQYGS